MGLKNSVKSVINRLRGKAKSKKQTDVTSSANSRGKTDSEISAEEVLREEIFPKDCKTSANKFGGPLGKKRGDKNGTRPTNGSYKMIDPSDDSADAGKS